MVMPVNYHVDNSTSLLPLHCTTQHKVWSLCSGGPVTLKTGMRGRAMDPKSIAVSSTP